MQEKRRLPEGTRLFRVYYSHLFRLRSNGGSSLSYPFVLTAWEKHHLFRRPCLPAAFVFKGGYWWAYLDSNQGPTGYEPVALAN